NTSLVSITIDPADRSTVNTTTPLIQIRYFDVGPGIDASSLRVKVDGLDYTSSFSVTPTGASSKATLAGGPHVIQASINSKSVAGADAASSFKVYSFRALPQVTPSTGPAPLTVTFITNAEYSDGAITKYEWDFEGDGIWDTADPGVQNYSRTFSSAGTRNAM